MISSENSDAIADELGKLAYANLLLEEARPYTERVTGLHDVNSPFGPRSASAQSALDIELEKVDGSDLSFSDFVAGDCGGYYETSTSLGEDEYFGEDSEQGIVGEEYSVEVDLSLSYDDYCDYVSETTMPTAVMSGVETHYNGGGSGSQKARMYMDYDGEDEYFVEESSMQMSGDVTVTAGERTMRIQMSSERSSYELDDEREGTYEETDQYINNVKYTLDGQTLSFTQKESSSDDGETYEEVEQEMISFAGSVYLLDDFYLSDGDLNLAAYLPEYGYVDAEGEGLALCDDNSGIASGEITFDSPESSTPYLITYNGCGVDPVVSIAPAL
ncbi:MAG: hypothetical protein CMI02_13590 [Oceanospirillaceae bacterium]|nr:hypothetical protein [Oceanospirillaceae bacterium]